MVDQLLADYFAAELGFSEYAPVVDGIAMTTDGVGTKLLIAEHFNIFDTVGIDLVAMCANDLLCAGAEPTCFMDYYATGDLDLGKSFEILSGVNEGCKIAGAKLVGGETAQLKPMFKRDDWFDLAGFMIGKQKKQFDLESIKPGDIILGIPSSGLHSNGFTTLRENVTEWEREWLTPTRIYTKEILNNLKWIKACAHITGGGIHGNLKRIIGNNKYILDISLSDWWTDLYKTINATRRGGVKHNIDIPEFQSIFNCGWGMLLVADSENCTDIDIEDAVVLGEIVAE